MYKPFDYRDTPLPQRFFETKYAISKVTMWRYRRAGLPALVVGSKVFIKESDFVAFLERVHGQSIAAPPYQRPTKVSLPFTGLTTNFTTTPGCSSGPTSAEPSSTPIQNKPADER
jgi:hypothetical protein